MRAARPSHRMAVRHPAALLGFKVGMALLVVSALLAAVTGGLLRAQAPWPDLHDSALAGQAAVSHAALMLSAFLGSAIAVERAVAIGQRWAFAAPLASVAGGLLLLVGQAQIGTWLGVGAAAVFIAVNGVVVRRQPMAHTVLLLVGAVAWLIGNRLFAANRGASTALAWWFAFVVLTIAAERLEMSRLMRRHAMAQPALWAIVVCLLSGAALSQFDPAYGGVLFGVALMALAAWLAVFDIARRTVRAKGLSRYMAVCLLSGYVWLALAGLAWVGMALGCPGRDLALHALGLGFIVSMVMGHAPVILPAVAGLKLLFGPWFYGPLALLHASLVLRLFGGIGHASLRADGALLNAAALVWFAATVAGSALAWRLRNRQTPLASVTKGVQRQRPD